MDDGENAATDVGSGDGEDEESQHAGFAISGAITINDLHNDDTEAYITGGTTVNAPGALTVHASSTLLAASVAGAISAQTQQTPEEGEDSAGGAAIAGAFVWNDLQKDSSGNERETEAYTQGVTLHAQLTDVEADNTMHLWSFAAGGAGTSTPKDKEATTAGILGSADLDELDFDTRAFLGSGTSLVATQAITPQTVIINASSTLFLVSAAGGVAVSGKAGIGAGVDVGIIHNTVVADIGAFADIDPTGNIAIAAAGTEYVISVGVSFAIGTQQLGIVGAGTSENISPDVEAYVDDNATVETPDSILIAANDNVTDITIGGGIGIGDKQGFGAAVGNVNVDETVKAYIGSDDTIVAEGYGNQPLSGLPGAVTGNGLLISAFGSESLSTVGAGGAGGQKVGIAASVAVNTIDNDTEAYIGQGTTVNSGIADLAPVQSVQIDAGETVNVLSIGGALAAAISVGQNGGGTAGSVGIGVSVTTITGDVLAYIAGATVDAADGVAVEAVAMVTVFALALGGAVTVSATGGGAGGTGIGGAGAGSGVTVDDTVQADIEDGASVSTTGGSVSLAATDTTTVTADGGGLGIAVGAGGGGGTGISVGAAAAINEITNTVEAFIDGSSVTAAAGVSLGANETATIQALTIGGAVAVAAGSGSSTAVAGAGAGSGNTVANDVEAYIASSPDVTSQAGGVSISSVDNTSATANGGGVGIAVGAAPSDSGLAVTIGISAATNKVTNQVLAYIASSRVSAAGNVDLSATEKANIQALSIGGAISVGASGGGDGAGVGAAGAGSGNTIADTVEASIQDGSSVTTSAGGNVNLSALDEPTITANAGGVGIAGGAASESGVSVSLGVAVAINSVADPVKAFISGSTVSAAGTVSLSASETANIQALTIGGAIGVAGGGGSSVGVAAAGAGSGNTITDDIEAGITGGSDVTAQGGGISISATDNSMIVANAGGVGIAVGGSGASAVGATIGISAGTNEMTNQVLAYIDSSTVSAQAPSR